MNKEDCPVRPPQGRCDIDELNEELGKMGYVGIAFSMGSEDQMVTCRRAVSKLASDNSRHYAFSIDGGRDEKTKEVKGGMMILFMPEETAKRLGIPAKRASIKELLNGTSKE